MPQDPEDPRSGTRGRRSIGPAKALVRDFFEISSEPHRRYPTIADWPCLVIQEALYLPEIGADKAKDLCNFLQTGFRNWFRRVQALQEKPDIDFDPFTLEPFESDFFEKFTQYLLDVVSHNEVLYFDASPVDISTMDNKTADDRASISRRRNIIVRGEIHQKYFALTMFLPIEIKSVGDEICCSVVHQDAPFLKAQFSPAAQPGTWGEALNWFYECVVDSLVPEAARSPNGETSTPGTLELMQDLVKAFQEYALKPGADSRPPGFLDRIRNFVAAKFGKPVRQIAAQDDVKSRESLFTDFIGIVASEDMVRPRRVTRPGFASYSSNEEIKSTVKLARTLRFLEEMSKALYHSVFRSGGADVIACYLRLGSAIYLSNIGSQRTPGSKDPLRFLIIYPNSGRYGDVKSPAHVNRRWWLSRLIHRLLSAGTMRVKALRNLKDIYNAGEELADLERKVERLESQRATKSPGSDYKALNNVINLLANISSKIDGSLLLRVNENRLSYRHMERQLADLEVVRIPGWQSYSAFVNRRLVNTYEKIGEIGQRYDRLWSIIRTRMEAVEAQASVNLQRIGTSVAVIGLPAALTPIVSNAFDLDQKTANYVTGEAQLLTLCGSPMIIPGALCAVEQIVSLEPVVFIAMLVLSVAIWITVSRTVAGQAGNQTGSVRSGADAPNN